MQTLRIIWIAMIPSSRHNQSSISDEINLIPKPVGVSSIPRIFIGRKLLQIDCHAEYSSPDVKAASKIHHFRLFEQIDDKGSYFVMHGGSFMLYATLRCLFARENTNFCLSCLFL